MKRLLALICGAMLLLAAGAGTASAKPGPDTGKSEKGLCTAYFNGQKKGHDKDGDGHTDNPNSPFSALEGRATDHDEQNGSNEEDEELNETDVSDDVFEYCDQFGIMGNPELNGRFDCREGEGREDEPRDTDGENGAGDGEIECYPNGEAPGGE